MGGRSYFCDYCRCYIQNDLNARRKHNAGLAHTIAKANCMRPYEDPRKVLAEESAKKPCTRYLKGCCKFDLHCQFCHYSAGQLEQLRLLVHEMDNPTVKPKKKKRKHLPPSLQPIDLNRLELAGDDIQSEWG